MVLCAMLVGGIVLHRHCRQAGALLWMKRSLPIALGLLHYHAGSRKMLYLLVSKQSIFLLP